MSKIHLIDFLKNVNLSDNETGSSKQRASELKKLLTEEYHKNQNTDLIAGAQKGLTEMFTEINKVEILQEIEYSIKLLENFESTGNLNLITRTDKHEKGLKFKYDLLKKAIESIIIK